MALNNISKINKIRIINKKIFDYNIKVFLIVFFFRENICISKIIFLKYN